MRARPRRRRKPTWASCVPVACPSDGLGWPDWRHGRRGVGQATLHGRRPRRTRARAQGRPTGRSLLARVADGRDAPGWRGRDAEPRGGGAVMWRGSPSRRGPARQAVCWARRATAVQGANGMVAERVGHRRYAGWGWPCEVGSPGRAGRSSCEAWGSGGARSGLVADGEADRAAGRLAGGGLRGGDGWRAQVDLLLTVRAARDVAGGGDDVDAEHGRIGVVE